MLCKETCATEHITPQGTWRHWRIKNGGTAAWNRKNGEPMNSCITCKEAIEHCMSTHTFAFAHLYGDEKIMDMHIHNCCEVYYSISGGKQFLIDHCLYDIRPGDLFLINQFESHHLTQIDQQTHERIILSIDPEYLSKLSTGVTKTIMAFHIHGSFVIFI